jgi:hypothetical protein
LPSRRGDGIYAEDEPASPAKRQTRAARAVKEAGGGEPAGFEAAGQDSGVVDAEFTTEEQPATAAASGDDEPPM